MRRSFSFQKKEFSLIETTTTTTTTTAKTKEGSEETPPLCSSRNAKMDALAAAKMKATTTVTLLIIFLIAVGWSAVEVNAGESSKRLDYHYGQYYMDYNYYMDRGDDTIDLYYTMDRFNRGFRAGARIEQLPKLPTSFVEKFKRIEKQFQEEQKELKEERRELKEIKKRMPRHQEKLSFEKQIYAKNQQIYAMDRRLQFVHEILTQAQAQAQAQAQVQEAQVQEAQVQEENKRRRRRRRRPINEDSVLKDIKEEEEEDKLLEVVVKASPMSGKEQAGSLWIRTGIFSLTVLLAAVVALISWTLQKKTKACYKKTSFSKIMK